MGAKDILRAHDERPPSILEGSRETRPNPATIVLVSGGFDPLHIGHVRLIQAAAKLGSVYVALNSDLWLIRKKGGFVMKWEERAEMLRALRGVNCVLSVDDGDGTVCQAIERLKPDIFANGGDRTTPNAKEHALCKHLGIEELFNVGGLKVQSSSALIKGAKQWS